MSNPITIDVPVAGQPNSTEDPKIASNFSNLQAWFLSPGITSTDLTNGAITATQLATNAVETAKIKDSTGSTDGVTTAKIATSAVTEAKLASGSVTTDKVADTTIKRSQIRVFTIPKVVSALPTPITAATGATTSGSNQITATTVTAPSGKFFTVGQQITCANFPSDTVITSVVGSTLTLNRSATATGTGVSVTAAPVDGDEIYFYPLTTSNDQVWHLRYNSSSSSNLKWNVLSAVPIRAEDGGVTGFTSTSYSTGTSTLTISLPTIYAEYMVTVGAFHNITAAPATIQRVYTSFATRGVTSGVVAADAASAQSALSQGTTPALSVSVSGTFTTAFDATAASSPYLDLQHKVSTGTTAAMSNRSIQIVPTRITP
jgi:hypothetical protein